MACLYPFEIHQGWEFDLTRPATQALILEMIQAGLIWYIHAGVPCTVWSVARRGITNHPRARAREEVSVELTMFCVAAFRALSRLGRYWSLENPASSRLFQFRPVVDLFGLPAVHLVTWDMCAWGEPHKKPTSLLTNMTSLSSLAQRCRRDHPHRLLSGQEPYRTADGKLKWRSKTSAAGEYPLGLCRAWALAARENAPSAAWQADAREFATAVHQRLQTIAGSWRRPLGGDETKKRPDIQPSSQPLCRAKAYKQPIIFGQHTKAEAAWLRSQGA